MKPQIATTREQSERLMKCGIEPTTADFVLMDDTPGNPRLTLRTETIEVGNPYVLAPAWSLSVLMAMLPTPIVKGNSMQGTFQLTRTSPTLKSCWVAQYIACHEAMFQATHPSAVEAIVQTIEWLTKNGYKLHEADDASPIEPIRRRKKNKL